MSMNYWSVSGYGVNEDDLYNASTDSQVAFIKKYLPSKFDDMVHAGEKRADLDMSNTADYLDWCRRWIDDYEGDTGYMGFGLLFAKAIQENEDGFYPEYFNQDGSGVILYEDRMPWEMTERVKNMTEDNMSAIFKKYLDELGVSANISRQYLEMYG